MSRISFDQNDLDQLRRRGLTSEEVRRQLALFADPPPSIRLDRPCRVDDGIAVLPDAVHEPLIEMWRRAAEAGRLSRFVPASGAASRMFAGLLRWHQKGRSWTRDDLERAAQGDDADASAALTFLDRLRAFPFYCELEAQLSRGKASIETALPHVIVQTLFDVDGLGLADAPKGLIPFHRSRDGVKTAFEEHLVEAAQILRDRDGVCRLHFTVGVSHERAFTNLLDRVRSELEDRWGARFDVTFSHQHPSTDTIAVGLDNRPFRDESGRILFRPGGHGALLANLEQFGGDVVMIKNIDNVVPLMRQKEVVRWKRLLAGFLVSLQQRVFDVLEELHATPGSSDVLRRATSLLVDDLFVPEHQCSPGQLVEERQRALIDRLDRPLRVCGVVRNAGEPGGGPFWVREPNGHTSTQIVESAEVDLDDEQQRLIWQSSTHFNPVDIVCGVRGRSGRGYDLGQFVDPLAVFIARKSSAGQPIKALERPGLWNGAMAGWNTVFVEVPEETFAPVKTVFDLLRPVHQS
ncbi:MAG: DUF4301 family protein [Acidobacteriota bacterium]|nr:MAG: DUF4301 family protein [Acidobacteriota bacterium]